MGRVRLNARIEIEGLRDKNYMEQGRRVVAVHRHKAAMCPLVPALLTTEQQRSRGRRRRQAQTYGRGRIWAHHHISAIETKI